MNQSDSNLQSAAQARVQLAEWLCEWELDKQLSSADDDICIAQDGVRQGAVQRYSDDPAEGLEEGSVLLLHPPRAAAVPEFPLYILVMGVEESTTLWVPFGRFCVPAIPEEWRTQLAYEPLRVLCFWNERLMLVERLPRYWRARMLTSKQLDACRRARTCVVARKWPTGPAAKRFGPPLLHPGDPRHDYCDEERERVDRHVHRAIAKPAIVEERPGLYLQQQNPDSDAFLLAAETPAGYGIRGGTYISEDHEAIVATYVEDPNRIRIRVVDRNGRLFHDFENGYLEASTGERSDRIRQGVALAIPALARQLAYLVDAWGRKVRLVTTLS